MVLTVKEPFEFDNIKEVSRRYSYLMKCYGGMEIYRKSKPFWVKWERYYHEDGSREIYLKDNTGYWYEDFYPNKTVCNRVVDHVNSYLAKNKKKKRFGSPNSCSYIHRVKEK
jgi:hypothetical protein